MSLILLGRLISLLLTYQSLCRSPKVKATNKHNLCYKEGKNFKTTSNMLEISLFISPWCESRFWSVLELRGHARLYQSNDLFNKQEGKRKNVKMHAEWHNKHIWGKLNKMQMNFQSCQIPLFIFLSLFRNLILALMNAQGGKFHGNYCRTKHMCTGSLQTHCIYQLC